MACCQGCQAEGITFAPQTKNFCLYSSHLFCSRMNPENMSNGCRDTAKTLFDPFSIHNTGIQRTSRWGPKSISQDLDLALQSEIADILQVNKVWKKVMESLGGKFAKRFLQAVTDQNLETNILGDPHVNARKICTNCHHQSCHRTHIKYLHDMCIHPLPCYYPLASCGFWLPQGKG